MADTTADYEPTSLEPQGSPAQPEELAGDSPQEILDENDPRLTSESLDDRTEADAFAPPPPLPDGKWRARLSQLDLDHDGKKVRHYQRMLGWFKPPTPSYIFGVLAKVSDLSGKFDGVELKNSFVKTAIDPRSGTSDASTIITKAGGKLPARTTQADRLALAEKLLAGEPEAIVETAWEVSCADCDEAAKKDGTRKQGTFLRGSHRFPVRNGQPDPEVACPKCGKLLRGRPVIQRFYAIGEVQANGQG